MLRRRSDLVTSFPSHPSPDRFPITEATRGEDLHDPIVVAFPVNNVARPLYARDLDFDGTPERNHPLDAIAFGKLVEVVGAGRADDAACLDYVLLRRVAPERELTRLPTDRERIG